MIYEDEKQKAEQWEKIKNELKRTLYYHLDLTSIGLGHYYLQDVKKKIDGTDFYVCLDNLEDIRELDILGEKPYKNLEIITKRNLDFDGYGEVTYLYSPENKEFGCLILQRDNDIDRNYASPEEEMEGMFPNIFLELKEHNVETIAVAGTASQLFINEKQMIDRLN